ncbi:unnamed protein product [Lota lota]
MRQRSKVLQVLSTVKGRRDVLLTGVSFQALRRLNLSRCLTLYVAGPSFCTTKEPCHTTSEFGVNEAGCVMMLITG